jgi:hypothetical protein
MIGYCRLGPIRFRVTQHVQRFHLLLLRTLERARYVPPRLRHRAGSGTKSYLMFGAQNMRTERAPRPPRRHYRSPRLASGVSNRSLVAHF